LRSSPAQNGLIAPAGRGKVMFTIPGFGDCIRRKLADEAPGSH
jgi:hypothetical protein